MITEVDILGRVYEIKFDLPPGEFCGEINYALGEINIDEASDFATRDVVLHEILHGILFETGLKSLLDSTPGLEEGIVTALEHGLIVSGIIRAFESEE